MRIHFLVGPVLFALFVCVCSPCHAGSSEIDYLRKMMSSQSSSLGFARDVKWKHLNSKESFYSSWSSMSIGQKDGSMEADKVGSLPGQPKGLGFNQYAGYVTVDAHSGRALFYYFVESPQDSLRKPLVLWLNGGPGCSSFGIGAMLELGPLRVNSDGETLYANEYAWNKVANIIFLESPAGVGFSYSNLSSDYESNGDKRTADDTYIFLINWLERFPHYKGCDFYITGESYAGHYVPELAYTIITNNKHIKNTNINLKGIAVGNGYLDGSTNFEATVDYIWTHALISDETYKAILSKCNFTSGNFSDDCDKALISASMEIGNIDAYNIYSPICLAPPKAKSKITSAQFDPCGEFYVTTYLNLPEVQKALHANVTGLPYPWTQCSGVNWNDAPRTMLPTIKKLIASGIRVWLYSGDLDAVCPVTSTRYFINMLHLTIQTHWRPWYTNKEVGGYVVGYEGLTFVTVRGAGHMVPINQPERALTMITSFLKGELPPVA